VNGATVTTLAPAGSLLHTVGALLLVLGVIFALAWLARRLQGLRPSATGVLRIEAGVQVGTRERVIWLRAGDKHLLIGVSPGRVQTLHIFDQAPRADADAATGGPAFGDLLKRALGRESS
jgi:flagellar protein FliO/FliZ